MLGGADPLEGERGNPLPLAPHSVQLANSFVAKSGQGCCYGFEVYNSKAAQQFILRFDLRELPGDGAAPAMVYPVPASTTISVDFPNGLGIVQGFILCNSSTDTAKTIGAADCWFSARVV